MKMFVTERVFLVLLLFEYELHRRICKWNKDKEFRNNLFVILQRGKTIYVSLYIVK